jgi:hypothetical protein
MNQSNSKNLVLTAAEARNIESDLVDLLLLISNLSAVGSRQTDTVEVEIQSPSFK